MKFLYYIVSRFSQNVIELSVKNLTIYVSYFLTFDGGILRLFLYSFYTTSAYMEYWDTSLNVIKLIFHTNDMVAIY